MSMTREQWSIAIVIDGLKNLGREDINQGDVADLQALLDNWPHFSAEERSGVCHYVADCLLLLPVTREHQLTINGAVSVLRDL